MWEAVSCWARRRRSVHCFEVCFALQQMRNREIASRRTLDLCGSLSATSPTPGSCRAAAGLSARAITSLDGMILLLFTQDVRMTLIPHSQQLLSRRSCIGEEFKMKSVLVASMSVPGSTPRRRRPLSTSREADGERRLLLAPRLPQQTWQK